MAKQKTVNKKNNSPLLFSKKNYQIMIAGVIIVILGLFIMSMETAKYGFGFLGLTLGPIVILSGFIVQFFAIFSRDKSKNAEEHSE